MNDPKESENTYYSLLGVHKEASDEEIRAAFRRKAKEVHPDRIRPEDLSEDTTALFQKVREAFETLIDPQKRAEYDRNLMLKPHTLSETTLASERLQKIFGKDNSFFRSQVFISAKRTERTNGQDVPPAKRFCTANNFTKSMPNLAKLSPVSTNINSPQQPENSTQAQAQAQAQGSHNSTRLPRIVTLDGNFDIQFKSSSERVANFLGRESNGENLQSSLSLVSELQITFEESVLGCQKRVTYKRKENCSQCLNSSVPSNICDVCRGTKLVVVDHFLDIKIPAGVLDGSTKTIVGEGHCSPCGKRGDFLLTVKVGAHRFLRRRDHIHVECDLPVSFVHATLGASLQIPSIRGQVRMTIPAGTQPNQIIRIPGEGFVDCRNPSQIGDMFVRIIVQIPKTLSQKQRDLLREFEKASHTNSHVDNKKKI